MDKKNLDIIVEGAQSTGKSTLIKELKVMFPESEVIAEVARRVIREEGIGNYELQNNVNNCFQDLQYKILQAQLAQQLPTPTTTRILDRSILSPLIYTKHYFKSKPTLADKIQTNQQFQSRIAQYKGPNGPNGPNGTNRVAIFLLYPHESIVASDGVRKEASFGELVAITELYREVMDGYGVRYCLVRELAGRGEVVRKYIQDLGL